MCDLLFSSSFLQREVWYRPQVRPSHQRPANGRQVRAAAQKKEDRDQTRGGDTAEDQGEIPKHHGVS